MGDEEGPRLVPVKGSLVGGRSADKPGRITEALQDMRLAINGMAMQFGQKGGGQGEERTTAVAALALACSIFLCKTVLGDFGKRETRLLDDDVLEALGFRVHPLVKIPRELRRLIRVEFGGFRGGELQITQLNKETLETERIYTAPMGPQTLEIGIEWPIPGAIGWVGVATEHEPWSVTPGMLFQLDEAARMDCDAWLGQQVVRFDDQMISLRRWSTSRPRTRSVPAGSQPSATRSRPRQHGTQPRTS